MDNGRNICPNCGREVGEGAYMCLNCGKLITNKTNTKNDDNVNIMILLIKRSIKE